MAWPSVFSNATSHDRTPPENFESCTRCRYSKRCRYAIQCTRIIWIALTTLMTGWVKHQHCVLSTVLKWYNIDNISKDFKDSTEYCKNGEMAAFFVQLEMSGKWRHYGHHFTDDIFRCVFVNEKCCIMIKFSLKFVPKGSVDNNSALVWIMASRRIGDRPLS